MKKTSRIETRAYTYIKNQIDLSHWSKDRQIKELDISRELAISRTPVRKALERLIKEKYVYRIPNKGVFVGGKPLDLNQRKERIYFLEAMLQHIFYTLQLDECVIDTAPLSDMLKDMKKGESLETNGFEKGEIVFWESLLAHHSNTYMNERVLDTMTSLFQEANQIPVIFRKSRAIKISHYQKLLDWLSEKDYTYARREIRILLNQLLINLIQGVD